MEEKGCCFSFSSGGSVLLRGQPPLPPHPLPKLMPSLSLPLPPQTTAEKSVALRIHKEAEKRRRERINAHLSTLRRLVPNSTKLDKACLLGRVIDQVKELKRKVSDISQVSRVPKEANEVSVECSISGGDDDYDLYMKASICCEDRPDLLAQLTEAFQRLRLRTIKADVVSLGGRTHSAFLLCLEKRKEIACLSSFMESLRRALDAIASNNKDEPSGLSSKRRRMMQIPSVR